MTVKHTLAPPLIILLGAFGLRLVNLGGQSFWWDEALSMLLALAPRIEWRPADAGHPPLYDYAILKPWLALVGSSEFAARCLSVAFGVLAVALAYQLGRRLFNPGAGLAAALLMAVSPLQWWYSQEVRMYTLVTCLILLLLILLVRVLDRPATAGWPVWAAIGGVEVLALYTQYLSAVVIAWVNVVALASFAWRRDGRSLAKWLGAQALAVALALPFLLPALGQVTGYIPPNATSLGPVPFLIQVWGGFTGGTLALLGSQPTYEALAVAAAVAVAIGTLLLLALDPARRRDLLLLSFSLVPLTVIFAIMWLRPGFHPRYVVMLSGPWLVYVGRIVAYLWQAAGWQRLAAAGVAAVFLAVSAVAINVILASPQYQRDDVRALAQRLSSTLTADDVVLLDYPDYALDFYYKGPAPAVTLDIRAGDAAAAAQVAEATRGRQQVAAVTWVHSHFDPRGFLPWLLAGSGRRVRDWSVSSLNVDEYRLDAPVTLPDLRPAEARFPGLTLTGVALPPTVGRQARVALGWRNEGLTGGDLKVALSLLDERGRVLTTRDGPLVDAFGRSLAALPPGAETTSYATLRLPPGTPPLDYAIGVSVYDAATLQPLDVLDTQGAPQGRRALVGQVRAGGGVSDAPTDPTLTVLNAAAGPGLVLEGYAVEPREAAAGQRLAARLRWRATQAAPPPAPIHLELVQDGRVIAGQQGAPADGAYPTDRWAVGEVVLDRRDLSVPGGAASGAARLQVRVGDGAPIDLGEVILRAGDSLLTAPPVQVPLAIAFGPGIRLVGYDLPQTTVKVGETLPLTLVWQATAPGAEPPLTVFTHLLDNGGRLVAQHDAPPDAGRRPTVGWVTGEYIIDAHNLAFTRTDYAGEASIEVGLYDAATGARAPTPDGSGRVLLPTRVTVVGRP